MLIEGVIMAEISGYYVVAISDVHIGYYDGGKSKNNWCHEQEQLMSRTIKFMIRCPISIRSH